MADYMAAEIEIGGDLPKRKVKKFLAVLNNAGIAPDYGESCTWTEDDLRASPLRAVDAEARWGHFQELEAWLQDHGLSYIRTTEGKWEWDGAVVWWMPGMDQAKSVTADQQGGPVLELCELRKLKTFEELQALLDESEPPRLPPFRIV